MPPLHGLRVVRSKIHGYGVVALRPIRKGEVITYGDGVLYQEDEEFDDSYALVLHNPEGEELPNVYYDLADQTRWINHACDPNSEIDSEWDPVAKIMSTWWVAVRDIEPGEEIAYDYAFSAHLAERCNCGSAKCRGLIVDEDEIDDVPDELRAFIRRERAA
jgi:SET domain-containing protein